MNLIMAAEQMRLGGDDPFADHVTFYAPYTSDFMDRVNRTLVPNVGSRALILNDPPLFDKSSLYMSSGAGSHLNYSVDKAMLDVDDFTVEAWVRTPYNLEPPTFPIVAQYAYSSTNNNGAWIFGVASGRLVFWYNSSQNIRSNLPINDGQWHHVAVTRKDGVLGLWVDGQKQSDIINATRFKYSGLLNVATNPSTAVPADNWMGIGHLRITAGVARYTAPFALPTGPFPLIQ